MRSLFIASIGNPGPQYANTLHSAGHTLLSALCAYTQTPVPTPGRSTPNPDLGLTFWSSPSLMNVSGPPLLTAWRTFSSSPIQNPNPHLVILHDELELPTGKFSFKTSAGGSARGHNGLKSFLAQPNMKGLEFTRVGVGIGPRPTSREPDVVAKYVLGRMTRRQREEVEGCAEGIWERLRVLRGK